MSHKFRASYSVLNAWQSGNWQRAVEMYFKLADFTTRAMAEGKKLHKEWEKEIKKTKCMPEVFGGAKLKDPKTEVKKVVQLDDWLELVGVVDLVDLPVLKDWKTGKTPSERYAGSFQPKVYHILFPEAKRFEVHRFDQYNKRADMSIVHLTEKTLKDGVDWIVTYASEMHSYLEENKLYQKFAVGSSKSEGVKVVHN